MSGGGPLRIAVEAAAAKRWRLPIGSVALLGVAGSLIPLAGPYWLRLLTTATVYAVPAAAVAILYGRLGIVSLDQVALLGIGGWVYLRLGHAFAVPALVALAAAAVAALIVGTMVGLACLRLGGLHLSVVTLMVAQIVQIVLSGTGFPEGGPGVLGRATGSHLPLTLPRPGFAGSDRAVFWYTLTVAASAVALLGLVAHGPAGRAWAAIRHDPAAARSAGVAVALSRLGAVALTSLVTGAAGGLLATGDGQLDPTTFTAAASVVLFAAVMLAGPFDLGGAVLGGLLYVLMPAVLNQFGLPVDLTYVVLALGLLRSLAAMPEGLSGMARSLTGRVRRHPAAEPAAERAAEPPSDPPADLSAGPTGGTVVQHHPTRPAVRPRTDQDPAVLAIDGVGVRIGSTPLLTDVTLHFGPGVHGLVGPNGAGKTTLVNVVSGFLTPSTGVLILDGRSLLHRAAHVRARDGLRRTFQNDHLVPWLTAEENVLVCADQVGADRCDARRALDFVGFTQPHRQAGILDATEQRLVEIARAMVGKPRLLLLDEPGAGLDEAAVFVLAELIRRIPDETGAAVVLIDHDLDLVASVCAWTAVLDRGRQIAVGPTRRVLVDPAVIQAYLGPGGTS